MKKITFWPTLLEARWTGMESIFKIWRRWSWWFVICWTLIAVQFNNGQIKILILTSSPLPFFLVSGVVFFLLLSGPFLGLAARLKEDWRWRRLGSTWSASSSYESFSYVSGLKFGKLFRSLQNCRKQVKDYVNISTLRVPRLLFRTPRVPCLLFRLEKAFQRQCQWKLKRGQNKVRPSSSWFLCLFVNVSYTWETWHFSPKIIAY